MALTNYQRRILELLSKHRIAPQESYLAGGAALTEATSSPRFSRDIDLFHDTKEALLATWEQDRRILMEHGYRVEARREYTSFIEAFVRLGHETVVIEWAVDSAFRFFPLVRGPPELPSLHPFDLATNKTLALIGRLEPRDWVDVISCHDRIQRFGLLCWAACGKDPGTNPSMILSEAARSGRYTQTELSGLLFEGKTPDAVDLSGRWRTMLTEARAMISLLPTHSVGTCVLGAGGALFQGTIEQLSDALATNTLRFHQGAIRGSFPRFIDQ